MNKYKEYQEALTNLKTYIIDYDDEFVADIYLYESYKEEFDLLQKLVDKEKPYTLEEVKKEWEELGYEWCASNNNKHIVLTKEVKNDMYDGDYNKIISINSINKTYACYIDESYSHDKITFQEHNLLTKTFKALRWYDE